MASKLASDFLDRAQRSGLVAEAKLSQIIEQLEQQGVDLDKPQAIADALVQSETLTRWQADNLLQGKHKGFFLASYRLLKPLGRGGMGTVYLAQHELMRRRCAVKVLPQTQLQEGSSILERFYVEAQAVATLDHKNIVRAYDVNKEVKDTKTIHYLVMEFVDGQDIQALVQESGPLEYVKAADYLRQTADGLAHAHEHGLVHRDIKPANLLVDKKGVLKILDLGLARFYDDSAQASLTTTHNETVLGTADYLSPEQALDSHTVDHRTDIYSLGCTAYYMLTGHPPFPEGSVAQRLVAHQVKTPPPIARERPDAPADLTAIIEKMMAKKADARYQTAHELSLVLAAWLVARGGDEWLRQHSEIAGGSAAFPRGAEREPTRALSAPSSETELVPVPAEDTQDRKALDGSSWAAAELPTRPGRDSKTHTAADSKSGSGTGRKAASPSDSQTRSGTAAGKSGSPAGAGATASARAATPELSAEEQAHYEQTLAALQSEPDLAELSGSELLSDAGGNATFDALGGSDLLGAAGGPLALGPSATDRTKAVSTSTVRMAAVARRPAAEPPKTFFGSLLSVGLPILIGSFGGLLLVGVVILAFFLWPKTPDSDPSGGTRPAGPLAMNGGPPNPDTAQRRAAEDQARKKAEGDAQKDLAEQEHLRKAAEEKKRQQAELQARAKAEEDAKKKQADEAARLRADEETRQHREEEAAKKKLADQEVQRQLETQRKAEEAARRKQEEEDKRLQEKLVGEREKVSFELKFEEKKDEKIAGPIKGLIEQKWDSALDVLKLGKTAGGAPLTLRVHVSVTPEKLFRVKADLDCRLREGKTVKLWSAEQDIGENASRAANPKMAMDFLRADMTTFVSGFLKAVREARTSASQNSAKPNR